ncbi:MAG: hypothetical protein RLZZ34_1454 [Verrucomicrobiota bacterium]|jgi:hypothetical protein
MKRILLITAALLMGCLVLRRTGIESSRLRENSLPLEGQVLAASNQLAAALSSVDSRRQDLTRETAESESMVAELAHVARRRSQALAEAVVTSTPLPNKMPTWNPESPYIWLEKPLLKGLSFVVFGLNGSLSPPGLEFLALQPGEANPLSESLKRLVIEHKRQEASRSRVVQEHLPDIANDLGPKFTVRIDPVTEVSLGLRTEAEAVLTEHLGLQRMELFNGPITDGLSKLFGKQSLGARTLSFVRIPNGLFMMVQQQGDSETSRDCCFPDIRQKLPEHLHHLIPPEFLEKPPEPDQP